MICIHIYKHVHYIYIYIYIYIYMYIHTVHVCKLYNTYICVHVVEECAN